MNLHGPESRTQAMSSDCDDDYIDMEINLSSSSSSRFISFAVTSSPPHSREFEFQMCSSALASGESTTSPADELFYKGQLLPLHLPPRLQMVQKLLAASVVSTPISPRAAVSSPRRFSSSEIDVVSGQEEHCYIEISTELKRFIESNDGKSWSKKIKQSSIRQKLKASRAYIRSLFSRPGCSDSSEIHPKFKSETTLKKKKNPFAKTESLSSKNPPLIHRRSFSGVIQRQSQPKCSSSSSSTSSSSASSLSSSFSFGSNGSLDLQTLMRSSNASSENSIEGAIEHCKQSFTNRKSNVGGSENSSSRTSVSTCADVEKG
ncbi:probable membrane-associated kinase regulator 3 [Raphanus sativus]|uniref:Probable membrane-associated kinase regulator 3 n=1 Tax=Raphanus sativus TaxID=3726 RepID=A0A6J0JCG6_RAPSA|nr:probable membrane-associated kinase regulator 3 [Raphanus sativus]